MLQHLIPEFTMILVNAANGQQGKLLVPKLINAGIPVRAFVQSERSAAELRASGVSDVVIGDISDPGLMARALHGIEKVYHVCPGIHPLERQIGFGWIDAAKAAGVGHFVFSSVLHPLITDLVQHEIKRDIEEHLIGSGLEFTILQSLVDIGDVTDVAAQVLIDSQAHAAATYQLVGNGRYTARDMAAIMADVLERDVPVEQIPPEAYFKGLFGDRDLSTMPHEVSVSQSLTTRYSSHDFVGNSNVLTWLLGRAPTTFEQFIKARHATLA
jgi:uncharacterized protein YbjT (DUF2867 family)